MFFISFRGSGHIGPAHLALSWCMLYFTDRGMHNLILVLYIIYTGQPTFCLVHLVHMLPLISGSSCFASLLLFYKLYTRGEI